MPDQFGEKSQDATPHRRQQAREQGQVARSQDLASAVVLLISLVAMMMLGSMLVDLMGRLAERHLGGQAWLTLPTSDAVNRMVAVIVDTALVMVPLLLLFMLAGVAANMLQVGFLFLPEKLAPDINRINPLKGFQRIFSLSGVVRLSFGMFKVLVVIAVAAWSLWDRIDEILLLATLQTVQIGRFLIDITLWTSIKIGAALLVLAIFDYAYQWWKHEQDLKMTPQEVREEIKNLQGDPQIIARRRTVQRQLALARLSNSVPQADVVVTNPTELAVAIRYEMETMAAPIVVAKGAGVVAQRIRRLALENDIPVVEKKELAQILYKHVDINHPIPVEQYAAVAEVLKYVYELKGKTVPGMKQAA